MHAFISYALGLVAQAYMYKQGWKLALAQASVMTSLASTNCRFFAFCVIGVLLVRKQQALLSPISRKFENENSSFSGNGLLGAPEDFAHIIHYLHDRPPHFPSFGL